MKLNTLKISVGVCACVSVCICVFFSSLPAEKGRVCEHPKQNKKGEGPNQYVCK